jgi:hypothetical protein
MECRVAVVGQGREEECCITFVHPYMEVSWNGDIPKTQI